MNGELFDGMADRYDNDERRRVAGVIADALRERLGGCQNQTGLDYGCGTGLVGLLLAGCFERLLLVDASPQMVAQVRKKIEQAALPNAEALCAEFSGGVPAGLGADVVITTQVLLHIPDTAGILARLHQAVNPGGRLLIVDFDKTEGIESELVHPGFEQAELARLAKRAGFAQVTSHSFYRGQNLFMGKETSLFLMEAVKQAAAQGPAG